MIAIAIQQGQDTDLTFTLKQGETAVNLTGATAAVFRAYTKPGQLEANAAFSKTLGSGVTVVSATGGEIRARITSADSFKLVTETACIHGRTIDLGGTAYCDIAITLSTGDVVRSPVQQLKVLSAAGKP